MHQSTTAERFTAVISTIVAIALLGAAVTAQQSSRPASDKLASLESDLRYQIELAYRHDGSALRQRTAALEETLAAWRTAPRTEQNDALLASWLRLSMGRSLPGHLQPLPPAPEFVAEEKSPAAPPATEASTEAPAEEPVEAPPAEPADEPAPPREAPADERPARDAAPSDDEISATYDILDERSEFELPADAAVPEPAEPITPETPPATTQAAAPFDNEPPADRAKESGQTAAPPEAAPQASVRRSPAERTVAAHAVAATTGTVRPEPRIELNLAELNARIGGYHDGLNELEAAIVAGGRRPTIEQAMRYVAQAEQLAEQCCFTRLYYESLDQRERLFVAAPRSTAETFKLLQQVLDRIQPAEVDFLSPAEHEGGIRAALLERLADAAEATEK